MFDNTYVKGGDSNTNIKVNAVTGNILKNYQKSFFKRFNLNSPLAKELFDEEMPHLSKQVYHDGNDYRGYYSSEKRPVVIVQMMICGELEVLAEIMWKDDFDSMFIN